MAVAKTREGEAPAEPLNWSAWHAVANTLVEQQGCGSAGASPWDGETVIRTLADRTRTFHSAGSQASAGSSFSPHAKAQRRQDEVLGK
jgi:hypothetical protein